MIKYEWLQPWALEERDIADINALLAQLTTRPKTVDKRKIERVAKRSLWLLARGEDGHVKGMAVETGLEIPSGRVAYINDVVVDESMRGQHVGEELMQRLIAVAKDGHADRVELTSNPSRVAANALYLKLGFKLRDTNCYVLEF